MTHASAEQVFVTAHPAEPTASVLLRAGDAVLRSAGDGPLAVEPLRALFTAHVRERVPDDDAGALYAAVAAAAVVAALELALRSGRPERFAAVAALLPPEPGRA